MPRTFLGFLPRFLPSITPPTSPAAAVATPVTTAAFAAPFGPELALRAPVPADRAAVLRLPEPELPLLDDAELRPRDEAAGERLLDALALLGLLPDAEDLVDLFELPLLDERVFAWAIAPP